LGAQHGGANIAVEVVIFGTVKKLGMEIGHCWSQFFMFISKTRFFGMCFGCSWRCSDIAEKCREVYNSSQENRTFSEVNKKYWWKGLKEGSAQTMKSMQENATSRVNSCLKKPSDYQPITYVISAVRTSDLII
jgi:hypothetical protein